MERPSSTTNCASSGRRRCRALRFVLKLRLCLQAQVDFAEFKVRFASDVHERKVWLFAMVQGHNRYLWAQFVMH